MAGLVDLSGAPLGGAKLADAMPGLGGRVTFTETTEVDFPGLRVRFRPGTYLILHVDDFDRLVGTPGPTEDAKLAADA